MPSFKAGARIRETSTTTGTGTYTLDGAPAGFQAFSVLGTGNFCEYFATDGTNWEEGIGEVLTGPNRLVRNTILASSNAGAAVNWAAGTRTLRCGPVSGLARPRKLTKSVAGGAGTTTLTVDEQRRQVLEFTGALTGNRTVEVDISDASWIVHNNTTGAFTLTMKVAGQTGVVLPQGRRSVVYNDGADVKGAPGIPGAASEFDAGTKILFQQTASPTGWTKDTTHTNKAMRVTSGTVGSGGATGFTSVFGAGKTAGATTLTSGQIPSHTHTYLRGGIAQNGGNGWTGSGTNGNDTTDGGTGGGGSHDHSLSLDLQYLDCIVATKD